MKILVTGCAGFIGSKVSELLLGAGHSVIGVDNLNQTYDVSLKEWRLSLLNLKHKFTFNRMDIVKRKDLAQLFKSEPWDAVVNLAARAGVRQSLEDPWAYYDTNLTGTLNLLEICRQEGVQKFVVASSSSVYGTSEGPSREDASSDCPLSPYAASKKAVEGLCHSYHHNVGMDITALRFFTVFGPAGRPDMSIFRFIKWICEEEPLVLYGDGSQERDFTYVDDIARGTVMALKPVGYEVVNLGSDRPVPLNNVIAMLEEMLEKNAIIHHRPAHPADVRATWADVSKARDILGWQPEVTLDAGLRRSIDWYLEHRAWASRIFG